MDPNINNQGRPCLVSLPDGTVVDIATKAGANAFLNGVSSFDFFSIKLEELRKLRKQRPINPRDWHKFDWHRFVELLKFIHCIADNADENIFRAKVPESEIQDWLNFLMEEFKNPIQKPRLLKHLSLDYGDIKLLFSTVKFFGHALPAQLAFKSEFFQVFANFLKAQDGHPLVGGPLCLTMHRVLAIAHRLFDKSWSTEKIFKKFEESGILEQFLRCLSTVLEPDEDIEDSQFYPSLCCVLKQLHSCAGFLTQEFKAGTPCGDTLKAILAPGDGSENVRPEVLTRLQGIARLVEFMDSSPFKTISSARCNSCIKNPEEHGVKLLRCSRCQTNHYCSRECQKKDWETHKTHCRKDDRNREISISLRTAGHRFMNKNWEAVFEEIDKKRKSTGLEKSDLIVVVDAMPKEDGLVPALQVPPIFEVLDKAALSKEAASWFQKEVKPTSTILLIHYGREVHVDPGIIDSYRGEKARMILANLFG